MLFARIDDEIVHGHGGEMEKKKEKEVGLREKMGGWKERITNGAKCRGKG